MPPPRNPVSTQVTRCTPFVYDTPSFRRRPYGEGQLEPDLEHQDAQEEPGQKGKEQDQEEVAEKLGGRAGQPATAAECLSGGLDDLMPPLLSVTTLLSCSH